MEDIIKVENVAKGYAKHQVLQNLDLNIKKVNALPCLDLPAAAKLSLSALLQATRFRMPVKSVLIILFLPTAAAANIFPRKDAVLVSCSRITQYGRT